jgi:hypothetical protein
MRVYSIPADGKGPGAIARPRTFAHAADNGHVDIQINKRPHSLRTPLGPWGLSVTAPEVGSRRRCHRTSEVVATDAV